MWQNNVLNTEPDQTNKLLFKMGANMVGDNDKILFSTTDYLFEERKRNGG